MLDSLRSELQRAIAAGDISQRWTLLDCGDGFINLAMDGVDSGPVFVGVTIGLSRGRFTAHAFFPLFENYDCGRGLLPSSVVTASASRSPDSVVGDLDRRLLVPFLRALPQAENLQQRLQAEKDEQSALYASLRSRMPAGALALPREHRLRGTYHSLRTNVCLDVRPANKTAEYGYPASVDIEMHGVPPQIAAAILDLLGEEATN